MNPWALALLLATGGTFLAGLFTFVIGLAGAPGALLDLPRRRRGDARVSGLALLLTVIGQTAAVTIWIAAIFLSVDHWLRGSTGVGHFVAWVIALWVANAPAAFANIEAARDANTNAQHGAIAFTGVFTTIISLVLIAVPGHGRSVLSWVPHFGSGQHAIALPRSFAADRDSLSSAFGHFRRAQDLTAVPDGASSKESSPALDSAVTNEIKAGLTAGHTVSDAFLDWLHPGMREHFRGEYLAGQAMYLDGLQHQDSVKQVDGIRLIQRWNDSFWDANKSAIAAKAFPS